MSEQEALAQSTINRIAREDLPLESVTPELWVANGLLISKALIGGARAVSAGSGARGLSSTAKADAAAVAEGEMVVAREASAPISPPVQQIDPRNLIPTQTRNEMSGSQIKRLAKDMQKNGYDQSQPIEVVKNYKGRLEIQNGHHRREAAIKAGLDKVPVRTWE